MPGGEGGALHPRHEGVAALPGAVADVLALSVAAQQREADEAGDGPEVGFAVLPHLFELLFLAGHDLEVVHGDEHAAPPGD